VLSTWLGISGALGFCLLLVSGVPAGFIIFRYVRKDGMDKHQQMEKVIQVSSSELDRIRHFDPVDALQRREGFDRLDTILKEYIKNVTGISAECLTAKELFTFLKDAGLEISVQDLTAVLEDCERARYDKPENLPGIAQYNNGISVAQGILTPQ
jgi:hypothetical protein